MNICRGEFVDFNPPRIDAKLATNHVHVASNAGYFEFHVAFFMPLISQFHISHFTNVAFHVNTMQHARYRLFQLNILNFIVLGALF